MLWITDNSGNEYEIVGNNHEGAPILSLFYEGDGFERKKIGYANLFKSGETLRLLDIRILDEATLIRPSRFGFCFIHRAQEVRNFQRLGLGTKLLKAVFEFAKGNGFKSVTGQIFPRDLERTPRLPEWYAKNGFAVTETDRGFDLVAAPF